MAPGGIFIGVKICQGALGPTSFARAYSVLRFWRLINFELGEELGRRLDVKPTIGLGRVIYSLHEYYLEPTVFVT